MPRPNITSAHTVADYFLLRTMEGEIDCMTTIKIQKLLYYAQGLSLARRGRPMFDEPFEAWARGPVCKPVYDRFRTNATYGVICLSKIRSDDPVSELSDGDKPLLDEVWEKLAHKSGHTLVYMTHQEAPWKEAYGDLPIGHICDEKITIESIKDYFQSDAGQSVFA